MGSKAIISARFDSKEHADIAKKYGIEVPLYLGYKCNVKRSKDLLGFDKMMELMVTNSC